jgi:hypothetical protein
MDRRRLLRLTRPFDRVRSLLALRIPPDVLEELELLSFQKTALSLLLLVFFLSWGGVGGDARELS